MCSATASNSEGEVMVEKIIHIGVLTVSDRASKGVYEDKSGAEIVDWLSNALTHPWTPMKAIVADELELIAEQLLSMSQRCCLILTTGGTGPSPRDVTPEATQRVCQKILPGFGELMRAHSLQYVPTSILARQIAGVLNQTLIINLPGKPKAIAESLQAVFPAVPYCIDLIGGDYLQTNDQFCACFRPKDH